MECTLREITWMKRHGDLPPRLFIPEKLMAAFCPDKHETLLFED